MAFCGRCGTKVDEGAKFCPGCGASMGEAQQTSQQTAQQTQYDFSEKIAGLNNTEDNTADFDPQDIANNKAMSVLAYISWLVLIPIFGAKGSKFARFHANQGLVLAVTEIIWWIAKSILAGIFLAISWWIGSVISTVFWLADIVFVILAIIGIVNAAKGRAKQLPVIGKIKLLK